MKITKTKNSVCDLVKNFYQKYVNFLTKYLSSLLLLAIRISIGLVFVKSGLTKISNIDQTINLFAYEYNLPLLMPKLAAFSSIIFELGCGFAVIFGIFTRISVLPLIAMTLIIQLLVFQNEEHFYWLFLLTTLAIYGAGKISIDAAANYFCSKNKV